MSSAVAARVYLGFGLWMSALAWMTMGCPMGAAGGVWRASAFVVGCVDEVGGGGDGSGWVLLGVFG